MESAFSLFTMVGCLLYSLSVQTCWSI